MGGLGDASPFLSYPKWNHRRISVATADARGIEAADMTGFPESPCRAALIDALELLDGHGQQGAACYVAMALDALQDGHATANTIPFAIEPEEQR